MRARLVAEMLDPHDVVIVFGQIANTLRRVRLPTAVLQGGPQTQLAVCCKVSQVFLARGCVFKRRAGLYFTGRAPEDFFETFGAFKADGDAVTMGAGCKLGIQT